MASRTDINSKSQQAAYKKQARLENPELFRERNRLDYQKHKEARRAKRREYAKNNKETMNKRSRQWQLDNPEKAKNTARIHAAKRRAQSRVGCEDLTELEEAAIKGIYNDCGRLNKILGGKVFEVDHTIPLTRGGRHHPDNLQMVPRKWNRLKNNKNSNRWEIPYNGQ